MQTLRKFSFLFFVVLLLSASTFTIAQNWEQVSGMEPTDVFCLAQQNSLLYAITTDEIFGSADNGTHWQPLPSKPDTTHSFSTLFAFKDYLYLCTLGNGVFRSADSGQTWQSYSDGLTGAARSITGLTVLGDTLYAGTNGAGIYISDLKSQGSWKAYNTGLFQAGVNSIGVSGDNIVASVGYYLFIRARNSSNWIDVYPDTTISQLMVYDVCTLDQFLFVGTAQGVYRGSLDGQNWQKTDISIFPNKDIFVLTKLNSMLIAGLIYHNEHWIFTSDDFGVSWEIRAHEFSWLWDLLPSGNLLWAGRSDGLWYLDSDTWTNIEKGESDVAQGYELHQNYPNPFNPRTVIGYTVGANDYSPQLVDLSIYNLLGQKVATLVSEKQNAGSYSVEWDGSGFASGVYLYQLTTDQGFTQTKKLVLLK